jgi:hypothetical protein
VAKKVIKYRDQAREGMMRGVDSLARRKGELPNTKPGEAVSRPYRSESRNT